MRYLTLLWALLLLTLTPLGAQEREREIISEAITSWSHYTRSREVPRYTVEEYVAIADQILRGQNEDGGWMKNQDWARVGFDADSLKALLKPKQYRSTLDNNTTVLQIEFLSSAYALSGKRRFRKGAERGFDYLLSTQHPNGGWRGWDVDAITFNDNVTTNALSLWQSILYEKEPFTWVSDRYKALIAPSWERGLQVILQTQYRQQGQLSIWAQQYDHQSLLPCRARTYELPSLSPAESVAIVELLMRIRKPDRQVMEAITSAIRWFEAHKIEGKRIETVRLKEGHPEAPHIKRDRRLVDDPEAEPLWCRYYDLQTNEPFLCNRDGVAVQSLEELHPERRVGYSWYGPWANKVIQRFPKWLEKQQKRLAQEALKAQKAQQQPQ